jgi:serine/threonine protein kinase
VSDEAKDFVSKILVADPKVRLNCEDMLSHAWMTKDLSGQQKLSVAKTALSKYVSVRKEQSKRFIDDNNDDDDDM